MSNVTIFNTGPVNRFFVESVKRPLIVLLGLLADNLPEPTKENTYYPNTKVIIELRDEFFSLENNPGRHKAFKAIWNFVIILYDYDRYYRHRIDWLIERIVRLVNLGLWQPRESQRPLRHWREYEPINEP